MTGKKAKNDHKLKSFNKINPLNLRGLKQARFILECLERGQSEQSIIDRFLGDKQLVRMWISFLFHNHWTTKRDYLQWIVMEKDK